jgi:hypothetical protein
VGTDEAAVSPRPGICPGGESRAGTDEQILNSQVANGLASSGRPAFSEREG